SVEGIGLCALHVVASAETFREALAPVTIGADKWIDLYRYSSAAACASALRAAGMIQCALVPEAEATIDDLPVNAPVALWAGNERAGLSDEAIAACDTSARLAMHGFSQSFNLSVSVALATYRIAARRREAIGAEGDLATAERARLRARWYALGVKNPRPILARFVSNSTR
ncbi:MAG TPA: TrmH family RNA methyltransferase, partial [Kofleriaceae bacterium]|nr:TrmH family RNA methyltransferase [Kofleriaceae bacterium]